MINQHQHIVVEPRVPSDGVVHGETQVEKEARLQSWFLTVVYRGERVGGQLETSKLEILEANCRQVSVVFTGRIELVVNLIETTVYALGFCVGFVVSR